MKGIKVLITLVFSIVVAACSDSPEELAEVDGFYTGYKKLDVELEKTKEEFQLGLLYPSSTPSKIVKFGPFEMNLSLGGKVADGPFPLVIISHGSGGTNLGHRSIAFELVKQGFVVGIPLHPRNNFEDNQAEGSLSNWQNRPLHISASIDEILSYQKVSKHIDIDKVAVVGHSAGGYTALAVAGGIANTTYIIDLCVSEPKLNKSFCELLKKHKTERVQLASSHDSRVKAIVMMAPTGALFNLPDSLDNVDIPAFLIRAEKDSVLKEPYHSDVIAKNYKHSELLTDCIVENAGHYSFITSFPESMESEVGEAAKDPDGFNRDTFQTLLSSDIVSFLTQAFDGKEGRDFQPSSCVKAER